MNITLRWILERVEGFGIGLSVSGCGPFVGFCECSNGPSRCI